MKKIVLLVASVGKNVDLANKLSEIIKDKGCEFEIVNLVELELPLYTTLQEEKSGVPEKVLSLAKTLADSRALIMVAPEYNGTFPPVLNNAIAWTSKSGDDWRSAFNGKLIALSTHSGGGGHHVLMAMRQQLSFIGANVLGRQLLTHYSKELNMESATDVIDELLKLTKV